ncbi:unnamed protein product, partial [Nesidiocoris tenuis]
MFFSLLCVRGSVLVRFLPLNLTENFAIASFFRPVSVEIRHCLTVVHLRAKLCRVFGKARWRSFNRFQESACFK